ncbi:MAG: cysteine desulfurase [Selenomonadaceae bacterium]|nr:cysteine desulfurase [Selenomonadaceae bacterium]
MTVANSLNKIIYVDNAATTKIDDDALALMIDLQKNFFANPSSAYKLSRPLKKILRESREKIAACINAEPQEIFFTSGGTESDNWAIKSSVLACLNERPNIITSAIEHKAILNSCAAMKNLGCTVTKIPVDKSGAVNPVNLQEKISQRTKIISIMLANNEVGTIQPIKSLAEIAHAAGKIFHTDAVQAIGHIPVDVKLLGVDMLSASAHKFNGPKGMGFLYVRDGLKLLPYIDGGAQEFSKRAGTENFPAIAAMALALEKNCRDMENNAEKLSACTKILLDDLRNNNVDFIINGGENRLPGHLNLSFRNCDGETLLHRLDLKNICVSTGSACNSRQTKISHVLQALAVPKDFIRGTIRITFGKENSCDDSKIISKNLINFMQRVNDNYERR